MDWNIQELETLCESKGLLSPKLFVQTLLHQKRRVIYHADESIKIMEHYHKDYGPVIDLNSEIHMQALGEAEFRSICHAEACLQTMHAMANSLSQVVNITLVNKPLSIGRVSLDEMIRILNGENKTKAFAQKLKHLRSSKQFRYIEAFVNTIKHRNLLTCSFRAEAGIDSRNDSGVVVAAFEYRSRHYSAKWIKDIFDDCRYMLKEYVSIGYEINKSLQEEN